MATGFRRDVQGLRAVAVLLVVAYHAGLPVPGGYLGVDVFFVISGFLITGLLVDELRTTGRIRLAAFAGRRVRRLLPALAVMTTVTVSVSHFVMELGRPLRDAALTGAAASIFVANLQLHRADDYFAPDAERNPLLHTWSLSVEEQFYVALPLGLLLLGRVLRSSPDLERALLRGVAAVTLASVLLAVALTDLGFGLPGVGDSARLAFFLPITRAWEFLAGALLAIGLRRRPSSRAGGPSRRVVAGGGAVGGLLIIGSALVVTDSAAVPGLATLPTVVGTVLAIRAGSASAGGPLQRLLGSRAMVWIGDRSYGWYLWHWPLLVLLREVRPDSTALTASALTLSVCLAAASFRFIERPLRDASRWTGRRMTATIAAVSITVPALLSLAVARSSSDQPQRGPDHWREALQYEPLPCPPDEDWSEDCARFEVTSGEAPVIMMVGDSHCSSLVPAVLEVAAANGADVLAMCRGRTAFVAAPMGTQLGDRYHLNLAAVDSIQPAVVLVSNRSRRNIEADLWYRWSTEGFRDPDEAATNWSRAVAEAAGQLTARGTVVVWVAQVPEFHQERTGGSRLLPYVPRRISLAELEAQRGTVMRAEAIALDGLAGVIRADPADVLCSASCSDVAGRTSLYRDDSHLSPAGAERMVPMLDEAIRSGLGR